MTNQLIDGKMDMGKKELSVDQSQSVIRLTLFDGQ